MSDWELCHRIVNIEGTHLAPGDRWEPFAASSARSVKGDLLAVVHYRRRTSDSLKAEARRLNACVAPREAQPVGETQRAAVERITGKLRTALKRGGIDKEQVLDNLEYFARKYIDMAYRAGRGGR